MNAPRSVLLLRVLECLRDHPHADSAQGIATWLGQATVDDVEAALTALLDDGLVRHADEHWQLTRAGWRAAGPAPTDV